MFQILLAFLAGIATVASPCILPLLPILLGSSFEKSNNKFRPLLIVAGFVFVFSSVAVLLSVATRYIGLDPSVIRNIGIFILMIFGLLLLWPKPFEQLALKFTPFISKVSQKAGLGNNGSLSAVVLGMALGLTWTPCAGPVLASILTLIALQKDLVVAFILLIAYSIGVGLPMLVIGYGGQYIAQKVSAISKYSSVIEKVFGIIILLLAIAMYYNFDTKLYAELLQYYPMFNVKL